MRTYIGKREGETVFIDWTLEGGVFSATGEYRTILGDDCSSGGQNLDQIAKDFPDNEQAQTIHNVWKRWHLNDMRSGSPRQMKAINEIINPKWEERKELVQREDQQLRDTKAVILGKLRKISALRNADTELIFRNLLKFCNGKKAPFSFRCDHRHNISLPLYGGDRESVRVFAKEWEILNRTELSKVSHYDFCCRELEKLGLLADSEYLIDVPWDDGRGHSGIDKVAYKYGSRWLREDLPPEVITEIMSWVEVPYEEKTPLTLLCEKYVDSFTKVCQGMWTLKLKSGATFPFTAGSDVKDVNAEMALGAVINDARDGADFESSLEYCMEIGYEGKEAIRIAKALVKSRKALEECGLWRAYEDMVNGVE